MMKLERKDHREWVGSYDPRGNRTYVQDVYAIGSYEVKHVAAHLPDGRIDHSIRCYPVDRRNGRSLPEIYLDDGYDVDPRFRVQTTSYGPLDPDEFAECLQAQQEALEVARVLREELLPCGAPRPPRLTLAFGKGRNRPWPVAGATAPKTKRREPHGKQVLEPNRSSTGTLRRDGGRRF